MERDRSNNERLTKDQYVEKARAIWGDAYDYTDSEYLAGLQPIIIRCKKHDIEFCLMAGNHIASHKPAGCPVCAAERQAERRAKMAIEAAYKRAAVNLEKGRKDIRKEKARRENGGFYYTNDEQDKKNAAFMDKVIAKYGNRYDFSKLKYVNRDTNVTLICPDHGEFQITPRALLGGDHDRPSHGCWECWGMPRPVKPMTADEFFERMHKLYDATELDFMTSEFKNTNAKVTAYCRKHGAITHPVKYWLEGKGCEYCNGKFYPPDFLRLAREVHGDKYQYRGIKNINSRQNYIKIHCDNPDHHWHSQRVDLHLQGFGCIECSNYSNHKPAEQRCQEWIAKCIEKYGEGRYDYSRAHLTYANNDSEVEIRCCIHDHWFKTTPDNNLRTVNGSCPLCSIEFRESEGEATIRRWLQKHGILDFEQEYQLPNEDDTLPLQYLSADFWLLHGRDYIIIEYHGEQHYKDIPHFYAGKSVRTFAVQQHRDRYLRRYCHDNGIRLIEIPYWDFKRIDEILTEELLNINT